MKPLYQLPSPPSYRRSFIPKLIRLLLFIFAPACLMAGLGYWLGQHTPVKPAVAMVAAAVGIIVYWTAVIIISLFSFASRDEKY
jgi:hypothetical protein